MVARLVVDYGRRGSGWQKALFVAVWILTCRIIVASGMVAPASFIAGSLTVVFVAGPLMSIQLTPREVLQLPLSRRDFWRARWLAAVLLPTVALAAVKVLALTIPVPTFDAMSRGLLSPQTLMLSSLYDLIYTGVMFRVMIVMAGRASLAASEHIRPVSFAVTAAFLGGFVWPWLVRRWLPVDFSAISIGPALLMAIGVAHAVACYFYDPGSSPHRSLKFSGRVSRHVAPTQPSAMNHGLSALPLLIWREVRSVGAGVLWMGAIFALILAFDPHAFESSGSEPFPFFIWIVAMPFAGPTIESFRHVRVLPLGTRTLETILLGRALFGAALLASIWWIADRVATGQVPLHVDRSALLLLLGIRILGDVVDIQWQGRGFPKMLIVMGVFLGGAICASLTFKGHVPYLFQAYGLATIVVSIIALHRTLTWSTNAYKPRRAIVPVRMA